MSFASLTHREVLKYIQSDFGQSAAMISPVNLVKQVKVQSLGDFISKSLRLVGETQADEHEDFI